MVTGKRLTIKRSYIHILTSDAGIIFATKMYRLKRLKINEKEVRDEPFFRNVI